jgi:hypothetical protein
MEQPEVTPTIAELLQSGLKLDREDKARADTFEALVKTEGWQNFIVLLNRLIEDRAQQLLAPIETEVGVYRQEFVKGVMNGLILARDIPSITIAAIGAASSTHEEDNEQA